MQTPRPVSFTIRPRRRPRCPICTEHLVDRAVEWHHGYAICWDCHTHRTQELRSIEPFLGIDLVANYWTNCDGLGLWTPPGDERVSFLVALDSRLRDFAATGAYRAYRVPQVEL